MITLDEDGEKDREIDLDRLVVEDLRPPPRRINLRPVLIGTVILALGGGLGTAAYFASSLDMHDVIGALDVADQGPRLAMDMPAAGGAAPAIDGPLLTPPSMPGTEAPAPAAPPPSPLPRVAAEPPQPAAEAKAVPVPESSQPDAPAPGSVPAVPSPREAVPPPSFAGLPDRTLPPEPLPPAPIGLLVRQTPGGPLPVIGLDGRQAWREYARPFNRPEGWGVMAVVVGGLGLEREATEAAIAKLPPEVTLSFSPYANGLDRWVRMARDAGHEVLIGLPSEPSGYPARDPGPWGLLTSLSPEDNLTRLERVLARMPGYVGVLAEDGPFARSPAHLTPILAALKERGLMYVGTAIEGADLPPVAALTDMVDQDPFRDAIDARLSNAADAARQSGRAVVVAQARPVTLDRLIPFLAAIKGRGVVLAPVSAIPQPSAEPGKS